MEKTFRLIFLGAGFSRPAGLPLGHELFQAVRRSIIAENGLDNHVESDLERYVEYMNNCEDSQVNADTIDYEQFLGFLDDAEIYGIRKTRDGSLSGNAQGTAGGFTNA